MTGLGLYGSITVMPFTKGHKINVGRKFSKETIEKMRNAENSGHFKKGLTPWSKSQKGIHLSPDTEFKKGVTPWNKGKQYKRNENHWNWKGGISAINKPLRRVLMGRVEYKHWRREVFIRDNYTCVLCGASKCYLNADHIKPWAKYPELRYEISNGRTLCVTCHKKTESYGNRKTD